MQDPHYGTLSFQSLYLPLLVEYLKKRRELLEIFDTQSGGSLDEAYIAVIEGEVDSKDSFDLEDEFEYREWEEMCKCLRQLDIPYDTTYESSYPTDGMLWAGSAYFRVGADGVHKHTNIPYPKSIDIDAFKDILDDPDAIQEVVLQRIKGWTVPAELEGLPVPDKEILDARLVTLALTGGS